MRLYLLLLLLLSNSCIYHNIQRISPRERIIITTQIFGSKERLINHVNHKAITLKCDKVKVFTLTKNLYIKWICENIP